MSKRVEEAVPLFTGGFNCSQTVLMSFGEKYGLDKKQALKLGCGLGGGCVVEKYVGLCLGLY